MGGFRLRVFGFRALHNVDWSPEGVCLLAGKNGAGKSTMLRVLRFFQDAYRRSMTDAVVASGGPRHLIHRHRSSEAPLVGLNLSAEGVTWIMTLDAGGQDLQGLHGESLSYDHNSIYLAPIYASNYDLLGKKRNRHPQTVELKVFQTIHQPAWLEPFTNLLENLRVYESWPLREIRDESRGDRRRDSVVLHERGLDLNHVLRNWRNSPSYYEGRFEWVVEATRRAFPGLLKSIEYIRDEMVFYPVDARSSDDYIPLNLAADGMLAGLLALTAVAGLPDGGVVAFDELETHLHPHAIRSILASMRELAEERDLTVIVTSHSPVVMNAFGREPEQFYVLGASQNDPNDPEATEPVALTDLHDEDWLAQFDLGDLYDRLKFAAPDLSRDGEG